MKTFVLISTVFVLIAPLFSCFPALMVQLENLQLVANTATTTVNARGPLLNNHLQDVPVRVQEITLHSIHRGMAMALAASQV